MKAQMKAKLYVLIAIIVCAVLVSLTSCDPSKRIARIIKRNPDLVKIDTVWKKDTIYTAGASKDSTFHFYQHDTVVLKKDNLTVKYYFNKDSTIYINGKCAPDTIVKMYPVQVNSVSVAKALTFKERVKVWIFDNWWWMLAILWLIWKIFGTALKTYFPFLKIF